MEFLRYLNNPIIYTIVGVIIGFLLNNLKEYCKSKKINNNIFILIKTELDFNITVLTNFKKNTKFKTNEIKINCPNFSLKNWENFLPNIPSVFDNNTDIMLLYEFYNKLENLISSKYWVKPIQGEPKDIYGTIIERNYPLTENGQEYIDFNKKIIIGEIDKLIEIYENMSFNKINE